jgi:hypothetical protein
MQSSHLSACILPHGRSQVAARRLQTAGRSMMLQSHRSQLLQALCDAVRRFRLHHRQIQVDVSYVLIGPLMLRSTAVPTALVR